MESQRLSGTGPSRAASRRAALQGGLLGLLATGARMGSAGLLTLLTLAGVAGGQPADPLASWAEGPTKKSLTDFVARVTAPGGPDFVPQAQRIATFDNDGTLWAEQPIYVQFAFMLDRVKALAPRHPEWKDRLPFSAALKGDLKTLAAVGEKGLVELLLATHTGMTTDEFTGAVTDWLAAARHPRFQRPYTDVVYRPMLELLAYLRASGFKTYIVSGGTVEFMRVFAERVYGIPPEQVVGTTFATRFQLRPDRTPVLLRQPKIEFVDDGPGKPVGIQKAIGRRPVLAFGNSDGDLQMLQWTAAGPGARLTGLVHHTDAAREWAYDRQSRIGRLDKALDEARARGWTVVDMKADWRQVFAFE